MVNSPVKLTLFPDILSTIILILCPLMHVMAANVHQSIPNHLHPNSNVRVPNAVLAQAANHHELPQFHCMIPRLILPTIALGAARSI